MLTPFVINQQTNIDAPMKEQTKIKTAGKLHSESKSENNRNI